MVYFILDKIGKVNFPNYTVYDANYDHEIKTSGKKYSSKQFFVEPQSVIMLPKSYDGVDDKAEFKKKKLKFLKNMEEFGQKLSDDDLKYVDFGVSDYGWINEFLDYMYGKYKQYYINGHLPLFDDYKDECYWIKNEVDIPYPKSYYLSDIEIYLNNDYGIDTDGFYEWIYKSLYVEGKYWERFFYYLPNLKLYNGVKSSKNIENIIGLIKVDLYFEDGELPLFIDYYKEIKLR